jgi:crotonobetainyl-CoA hydratase
MVVADHAELAVPEVRVGVVADAGGLLFLPRRLPDAIAREMLLTGRRMGADEAARWGLANRVVPLAELTDAALALAADICAGAPLAVAAVQEVLEATAGADVETGFRTMREGSLPRYRQMLTSEDAVEGPRAFAEKRSPRWQGR